MIKLTLTILAVNILLKLDDLITWPWVTVLWPLFIILSVLFIASLMSVFTFMAWLCGWLMSSH